MKIEIKSICGNILFSYDCENNSFSKTLREAINSGANLSRSNLSRSNLSGADLSRAYLTGADLSRSNLSRAYLTGADLSRAYLSRAYLTGADLSGADLSGANLSGADLSGANLSGSDLSGASLPIYCKWTISIVDNHIKIGCKQKSIEDWDLFFASEEVFETKRDTEDFKRIHAMYLAYKTYLQNI